MNCFFDSAEEAVFTLFYGERNKKAAGRVFFLCFSSKLLSIFTVLSQDKKMKY